MLYEDPRAMLSRLRIGREEFCQRLITTLILAGTYPKWNLRSTPSSEGVGFLEELDRLSFGESRWAEGAVFVDEFELPPRVESEQGGYPDWAVIFPDRLWLIELKTERGSHRPGQLPYYFELAAHHYPRVAVDLTYITGPLSRPAPPVDERQRYAHITWEQVVPLVNRWWVASGAQDVAPYLEALGEVCGSLETKWSAWREAFVGTPVPELTMPTDADLLPLVMATAQDHEQRALDFAAPSLETLHALRLEARELIRETASDSQARHVLPWVWSTASTGRPLTRAGEENGHELRFSHYAEPQY